MNAIETDRLTKTFAPARSYRSYVGGRREADRIAVDAVDLSVPTGQVFGLLGQNGAGKTTLVRMLTTLLLPTVGTARIAGLDVVRDSRAVRARIGLISGDERSFSFRLSGLANLEFFAALQHLPPELARRRIRSLAERLEMAAHLDRPFGRLSSGQRQKLAIIRGLMGEPDILFMDEPTRSLDPISAADIRAFVAEHIVAGLGRTVVLATHSMREAEALCDRLAFLQAGRIVASGTVPELQAAIDYGIRCELQVAGLDRARLAALTGTTADSAVIEAEPDGRSLRLETAVADQEGVARLIAAVVHAGGSILACRTRPPSLEEIYVRTLGSAPGATDEAGQTTTSGHPTR